MIQLELDLNKTSSVSPDSDPERVFIAVAVGAEFVDWLNDDVLAAVADAFVRGARYDWQPLVDDHDLPAPGESYGFIRVLSFATPDEASLVVELLSDAETAVGYDLRGYDISRFVRLALARRATNSEAQQ
jgi:hypothetical protein